MSKNVLYIYFFLFLMFLHLDIAEKVRYISTERPRAVYFNPNYFSHFNMSSRRFSRKNPFYYVDLHIKGLTYFDNNITMHMYLCQDIGNGNYRILFEIHRRWCNFISMDNMFGSTMRQGRLKKPCPHPPGEYHMYNMSIPVENIPRSLPYFKGRIYGNVTHVVEKDPILSAYIDMEMKEYKRQ